MSEGEIKEISDKLHDLKLQISQLTMKLEEKVNALGTKVKHHEDWIEQKEKNFYGLFNYAYRAVIFVLITYIAYKLGLAK